MKAFIYILLLLLFAAIGGGALFYQYVHHPMAVDLARMKAGMSEMDRAKFELKKYRDRESWISSTMDTLRAGLDKEVQAGNAEVVATENGRVIVNIVERLLYTPASVTFAADSRDRLAALASLLKSTKSLQDKEIIIGNVTDPAPAQGKGKRKIPPREARDLSSARSLALVKYLEKNGVSQQLLVAAGYPQKLSDQGFKIKANKTVFIIGVPPKPAQETGGIASAVKPSVPVTKPSQETPSPAVDKPKTIPIQPAPPKPQ